VSTEQATVFEVDVDHASRLASAFRTWAGADAHLRVHFTPEVLIGIDRPERRGHLYDDGWTIEAWIERGVDEFRATLVEAMAGEPFSTTVDDTGRGAALLALVLERGHPFRDVQHLI
jgi:hypothetical protein